MALTETLGDHAHTMHVASQTRTTQTLYVHKNVFIFLQPDLEPYVIVTSKIPIQQKTFEGESFCEFHGFAAIRESVIHEIWGCGIHTLSPNQ